MSWSAIAMSFLKVLVVGDVATGKTSLVQRISSNNFSENYRATIGCEFSFRPIEMHGDNYSVQLWDLAGQDRFGGVSKLYCREAHAALVVCDISQPETVGRAAKWKALVDDCVRESDGSPLPMVLCLNKYDLVPDDNYTTPQLQAVIRENGFAAGFFTSAKTGYNANEVFTTVVTLIIKKAAELPPEIAVAKGVKLRKKVKGVEEQDRECC